MEETAMVETGGRNPRRSPDFVALGENRDRRDVEVQRQAPPQNPLLDRSSMEDTCDKRPLLPPNYVSLRQLRDMRLKEREEQEKEKVKQSIDLAEVPLECTSLELLQERHLKEEKQKEEDEEIEKGNVKEESENCSHLPSNFVSLRQFRDQQFIKEEERQKEEENVKEKNGVKAQEEEQEKVKEKNYPNLPPNYISLKHLKELREKEQKEAEKAAQKSRLPQIKVGEKGEEMGLIKVEINKKAPNMARYQQSKKPDKHGFAESDWVWKPVSPPGGTGTDTGTSSAGSVVLPQNDGVSHEVVMTVSHQIEDAGMKPKNKCKKYKKKMQSRKTISGKDKDKQAKGPEEPMEVTGVKIGKALNACSRSADAVTLSKNEHNTVTTGNEESANLTESSSKSIIIGMEVKRFNRAQPSRFKRHSGRGKGKGTEDNLSEQSHTVAPLSKVMKGSNGVEEVIGSKIEKDKEQKGKGNEEATLSKNENNTTKKGNEENANLTESSRKSVTVSLEVKKFNGAQSSRFKRHNGRGKGKGKEGNLSEQSHTIVPLSKVKKGSYGVDEVIGSKIEKYKGKVNEEVTLSQNEKNTVKKENEENNNLTESSRESVTISLEVKKFNGAQSSQFKRHNGRGKEKDKEVILSEQSHNLVRLSKVIKGPDGVDKVIGSKFENDKEQKGEGKAINVPELCDQMPSNEGQKGTHGAGEVIGSKVQINKENGRGKNVNLPELSKWGDRAGDNRWKRNPAACNRGRGHGSARMFPGRSAEHLGGGGGLIWVPKKSS